MPFEHFHVQRLRKGIGVLLFGAHILYTDYPFRLRRVRCDAECLPAFSAYF